MRSRSALILSLAIAFACAACSHAIPKADRLDIQSRPTAPTISMHAPALFIPAPDIRYNAQFSPSIVPFEETKARSLRIERDRADTASSWMLFFFDLLAAMGRIRI